MTDRIDALERDLERISGMKVYAALNYIRLGIGYDRFLKEYAEKRKLNLEELTETENEIQENSKPFSTGEAWEAHIEAYRKQMQDLQDQEGKIHGERQDAVTLSTFHSAKGLEFQEVYLVDVNEGMIPYKKAALESEIEEERRLFYVGMTRARKRLHILYVRERYNKVQKPSRFLDAFKSES